MLIFNSPSNPTGAAYSRDEVKAITEVLVKHPHVWLLTDDMYEHLVYDDFEFSTPRRSSRRSTSAPSPSTALSKTYCMTGWRIGYAGGRDAHQAIATLQSQSTTNPNSIAQWAAVEGLDGPQDFVAEHNKVFKERRDLCVSMLNQANGCIASSPRAPSMSIRPAKAPSARPPFGQATRIRRGFRDRAVGGGGVAVVQGTAFGWGRPSGFPMRSRPPIWKEACRRIQRFCGDLR